MKMTRLITNLALAAVAIPAVTAVAAQAEAAPTVVVMHRNIHNVQDEQNWIELARGLSADGYRVVSVAMTEGEPAGLASDHVISLLNELGANDKVLLVGTSSASEAISNIAQAQPTHVKALVYISAAESVPTFGPRTVAVPANLLGVVPTYQVKVVNGKQTSATTEGGTMVFKVREQGHTTLGRTSDMVAMIQNVSALARKAPAAGATLSTR